MNLISKIYSALIILILVNLGMSNPQTSEIKLWPFDFEIITNLGFLLITVFLFSFIAGGFYIWLNSTLKYKRELKETKRRLKTSENKLREHN